MLFTVQQPLVAAVSEQVPYATSRSHRIEPEHVLGQARRLAGEFLLQRPEHCERTPH